MQFEALGNNAKQELLRFCERVEGLIADRKGINEDIKEVFAEAEVTGFDKKTIKEIIKLRAQDEEERKEQEQLRDLYISALDLV